MHLKTIFDRTAPASQLFSIIVKLMNSLFYFILGYLVSPPPDSDPNPSDDGFSFGSAGPNSLRVLQGKKGQNFSSERL